VTRSPYKAQAPPAAAAAAAAATGHVSMTSPRCMLGRRARAARTAHAQRRWSAPAKRDWLRRSTNGVPRLRTQNAAGAAASRRQRCRRSRVRRSASAAPQASAVTVFRLL